MDTGCPLHVHVTTYTAYTVVMVGSGPTVRHLSLQLKRNPSDYSQKQWHVVSVPVHMDMHTQPWLSELWDEIWILVNKWEYKEKERTWRSWEPNRSNWCLQLRESWQNGGTSDCGGMQNKTESVVMVAGWLVTCLSYILWRTARILRAVYEFIQISHHGRHQHEEKENQTLKHWSPGTGADSILPAMLLTWTSCSSGGHRP